MSSISGYRSIWTKIHFEHPKLAILVKMAWLIIFLPVLLLGLPVWIVLWVKGIKLTSINSPINIGHLIQYPLVFLKTDLDHDKVIHLINRNKPYNKFFAGKLGEKLRIVDSPIVMIIVEALIPILRRVGLYEDIAHMLKYRPIHEYAKLQGDLGITFSTSEINRGSRLLQELGVEGWFVCIYARDAEFARRNFGNIESVEQSRPGFWDIHSAEPAIKHIIDLGGYVIRMGDWSCVPYSFDHDRYIDYPRTKVYDQNHNFMDFYLSWKARFVIANVGGYSLIPFVYKTPTLYVNNHPFHTMQCAKAMIMVKRLLRQDGSIVEMRECITKYRFPEPGAFQYQSELDHEGLKLMDNTPTEILEAVKEFLDWEASGFNDELSDVQARASDIYMMSEYSNMYSVAGVRPRFSNFFLNNHKDWTA